MKFSYRAILFAGLPLCLSGYAQVTQVVVTANRTAQTIFDTPASIDLINSDTLHDGQPEQNLSEALQRVPGIFALNRQNYAQDLLISSRGFGANSTFGARGIKLFVDGIPGTAADGQGQISHIDLASADSIEVLRGPFSVLYGNSSGGVVNVTTERGKPGNEVEAYYSAGSYGQQKYGAKFDGDHDGVNYLLDAGALHTDGYRDHSNTDRQNENLKLSFNPASGTRISITANNVNLKAQDPLGLTAAQFQADPRAAGTGALSYDTRKTVAQSQAGVVLSQDFSSNDTVTLSPYLGQRTTTQYLASGVNGVVNLGRNYDGIDTKWLHKTMLADMPLQIVLGVDSDQNYDHRMTYTNSNGMPINAATDQNYSMSAHSLDQYLQAQLSVTDKLRFTAGVRNANVSLSAISNNNLPSLGEHSYQATTGVVAAQYYFQPDTNAYLSYGSGFDTPTLNQVIYSPSYVNFGGKNTGNMGLQAATSKQVEIGLKQKFSNGSDIKAAIFSADTDNDIVIASSNGGKSAYLNAPQTQRQGLELSSLLVLPAQLSLNLSYTYLQATVKQAYKESITSTTNVTTSYTVASGNAIPGVPKQGFFADLAWKNTDKTAEVGLEARAAAKMYANDLNLASASGYGIMNLRGILRQQNGKWSFSEFARIDNLADKNYAGSVIVNQAANQFYEAAPGRNFLAGVNLAYRY